MQTLFSPSGCLSFNGSAFLVFCLPSIPPFVFFFSFCFSFSLSTVITVWRVPGYPYVWGLMAGLQGLLAMEASYCRGAGWSQWRPLDIPGTHLTLSSMQLLTLIYSEVTEVEKKLHAFNISNNHHHNKSSVLPQKNSHAEILYSAKWVLWVGDHCNHRHYYLISRLLSL